MRSETAFNLDEITASEPKGAVSKGPHRSNETALVGWCPLTREPDTDDEYFEALTAAVFEARFSAAVVRARWPSIRAAFAGFSLRTVAAWADDEVDRLLQARGIIRSPKKILATIRNARDLLARAERHGSVRAYFDTFRPDIDALVGDLDGWAHYIGAPSIRWFLHCVGIRDAWARQGSSK